MMSVSQKNPYDYDWETPDALQSSESPSQSFPLIVFLHGIGECGGDKAQVRIHGPWKDRKFNEKARAHLGRYFVVAPHKPQREGPWEVKRVLDILCAAFEEIRNKHGSGVVDRGRGYVTGISHGGRGALELASVGFPDPDRIPCDASESELHAFKAAAIICPEKGAPEAINGKTMYQFFHRENDYNPYTRNTYEDLKLKALPHARFKAYQGCNHNCWTATYANPSLYEWFDDPSTQPEWGDACDFDMCVESDHQPIEFSKTRGGRNPISACFCSTHAKQVKPWLSYIEKLRDMP
jgi:hypothetical protein